MFIIIVIINYYTQFNDKVDFIEKVLFFDYLHTINNKDFIINNKDFIINNKLSYDDTIFYYKNIMDTKALISYFYNKLKL